MPVEVLNPDSAPLWLNVIIWMGVFWQYILIGFLPAFYIAITKLFGFPLLQRWPRELVIMLFPNKVKFGKVNEQYESYFKYKKGIYWFDNPLHPVTVTMTPDIIKNKLGEIKLRYEELAKKPDRTKKETNEMNSLLKHQIRMERKQLQVSPENQVHVYTHAVNQPVDKMSRKKTKATDLLHNDSNPKKLAGHSIWVMRKPRLHFHRHFQLIIKQKEGSYYLLPVSERQQFGIGFWHSLGIIMEHEEVQEQGREIEVAGGGMNTPKLIQTEITTNVILQFVTEVQSNTNYSARRAFAFLERRHKIEENYSYWVKGNFNMKILLPILGGMVAIGLMMFFLFGTNPAEHMGKPPG